MVSGEQNFSVKRLFTPLTTVKAITIIGILGLIVFGNALFNGFVWDDIIFIIQNPDVHSFNILHLFSNNRFNSIGYYRPIPAVYFAILYNVFGSQAFFYHFLQISLHILNTILLFVTLRTIFGRYKTRDAIDVKMKQWDSFSGSQKIKYLRRYGSPPKVLPMSDPTTNILSLFFSLVFLVHPINVESVSYIASTQSELFFFFGILALFISVKEKIDLKDIFLVSGLTLLSLLTKETGFLFLLMILCFQFLFSKRRLLKFFLFELSSLSIYSFFRFVIGGVFFSKFITYNPVPMSNLSLSERLTSIPAIVWYYLTTTFFPLQLVVNQQWAIRKFTVHDFYLPLLLNSLFFLTLCLGGAYIYNRKRNYFKTYLFFFLWFIAGLLLIAQIFPLDMTVSDRWFYFPIVGMLGMLAVGVQVILFSPNKQSNSSKNYEKAKMLTALFGVAAIMLLSVRTIVRNTNFHDEITLYTHDLQIQENATTENDLGLDYIEAGNKREALKHFQKSVHLYPYPDNQFNLGFYYEQTKNLPKAKEYYFKAFTSVNTASVSPGTIYESDIYIRLAGILLLSGEYEAAEKISKKGVQYYPDSDVLWEELAVSENKVHNQQEAMDAVMKAKTISPGKLTNALYSTILNKQDFPPIVPKIILNQ